MTRIALPAGIFALALGVRLAWILKAQVDPGAGFQLDMTWYSLMGMQLATGAGYVTLAGQPTAAWPPGYPALLGLLYFLFGHDLRAAQFANALLGSLTCLATYGIGSRLFGRGVGVVAALLLALYPSHVMFTALLMSEVAFTAVFVFACLLFCTWAFRIPETSWPYWTLWGVLLGVATLLRGTTLGFVAVPAAIWLLATRSWRYTAHRVAAVLLGFGLVLGPWTLRNAIQMKAFVLVSTSLGRTLAIAHLPRAGYERLYKRTRELDGEVALDRFQTSASLRNALENPGAELRRIPRQVWRLYASDHVAMKWGRVEPPGPRRTPIVPGVDDRWVSTGSDVYHRAILLLALIGLPAALGRSHPSRWLLAGAILYVTVLHSVVFNGNPRFHLPLEPLFCVLAGAGLVRAGSWLRRSGRPGEAASGGT